jgi:hypothetical protein
MESSPRPTGASWFTFAGVMFVIAGVANLLWGIAALDSKEYLPESGLLVSSLTFWGWVSIIWAALAFLASYLLLTRSPSGAAMGVVMATLSGIFWLFALPVLPIWALLIILIDVLIIYGLTTHGDVAAG